MYTSSRQLIIIDHQPLREAAFSACQAAYRHLESLKAAIFHHESRDLPEYARWRDSIAAEFRADLDALNGEIKEKEATLRALSKRHWASFFGTPEFAQPVDSFGRTALDPEDYCAVNATWEAYREERDARARFEGIPEDHEEAAYGPDQEEHRYQEQGDFDDERGFSFDDCDEDRWIDELFGSASLRGKSYSYYRERSHYRTGGDRSDQSHAHHADPKDGRHRTIEATQNSSAATDDFGQRRRNQVKDRYRALVRKLHPDLNPELTPDEKRLWNQVQVAYAAMDLDQLELLAALAEAFSGSLTPETTLHQLLSANREIRRFFAPLERRIQEAQTHPAWGFSLLRHRRPLQEKVEAELMIELKKHRRHLREIDAKIRRFSRGPKFFETEHRL